MLVLALAAQLATQSEFSFPFGTSPMAPVAVDHVAVVAVDPGYGPEPRERRRGIARSGRWLRELSGGDGGHLAAHHDFISGATISHWHHEATGNRGFTIDRHASDDDYYRYRRSRTGERDRLLGEECFVWRFERVRATQGNLAFLSCETADGIQLWSRTLSGYTGQVIASSRALSFERRPVAAAEVEPPRALLRWRSWRALEQAGAGPATQPGLPPDYEVRLEGGRGSEQMRILRARGGRTYEESRGRHQRSILIRGAGVTIHYRAEPNGRPLSLAVRRLTAEELTWDPPALPPGPLRPPVERFVGESCSWDRMAGQSADRIVVTSGTHRICHTIDGLPLRIYDAHRSLHADLTATRVSRRRLPPGALDPPRPPFSWADWGISLSN